MFVGVFIIPELKCPKSHLPCFASGAGVGGDPYWTRVWPSAIALAQQLLQRPQLVAGKKVADLGAGLGVAGIAAALAGGASWGLGWG
jgi:predicted nicotinamide N-methyase